jgi:hypothetical protein
MVKSKAILLTSGVVVAVLAGAGLPVERGVTRYPELRESFGYRFVRVAAVTEDTTRVRVTHASHRELAEADLSARAQAIADVVRAADPALADDALVVELAWTWRSDLVSRRSSVRHIVPRVASR